MKACVTDSTRELSYCPTSRPGVANLLAILGQLEDTPPQLLSDRLVDQGVSKVQLKERVTAALVAELGPVREELSRLLGEPGHLDTVLAEGGRAAAAIAGETMADVRRLVGFRDR